MRYLLLSVLLAFLAFPSISYAIDPVVQDVGVKGYDLPPSTAVFNDINEAWVGNWQERGQQFTRYQSFLFSRIFLMILVLMPTVFLLHYIVIGAKSFSHDGGMIQIFSVLNRLIHWITAVSFSLLVITGLMVIFGRFIGGGAPVMTTRSIHLGSAMVFSCGALCMLLTWIKDMVYMPYDILWVFIMGGYLSKKKKPVPAGKFNAGQKSWFWLATIGGGVMAWTGYQLWAFQVPVDQLRLMAIIHNFLGSAMVAFFIIHLYMSLFAIKGSLASMITGNKPLEELQILHSRFNVKS